ncbi:MULTISPECIES: glycosyltransferase family 2 protein [Caloramator]|uniref:Glycosyltransferase involved in cell wall bisynthesis n=1 Tax=Caloramator proteoclasticus DSM 10124 TaxID=1121262 RepID=A0A1M4YE90_9CLOT|nr:MULTISPECIES: glycosyltransferase family 2 protein [Caloramator]SHF04121.1 Glycosyltransferase involved in cell wall bisynthesis [Caloramator proteoclasticus DSM 10124]
MQPLVSVVIPAFNCGNYIKETVESVLNQTYKNIEIIIVDDGSTDNTKQVVESISKDFSNIKYIRQENAGVSVSRNRGILESNGEYIAFLDSDDVWEKEKIEKQINRIITTKMDACYCGYTNWYSDKGEKVKQKWKWREGNILFDYLKFKTWGQTSTWIVKKSILIDNNIFFTPKAKWAEDAEFFIKVTSVAKVCCVKEYLVLYRIRENSLTKNNISQLNLNGLETWRNLLNWFDTNKEKLNEKVAQKSIFIIEHFLIPRLIIKKIYENLKYKEMRNELKKMYIENKKTIESLAFINSLEGMKTYIKLIIIKVSLK